MEEKYSQMYSSDMQPITSSVTVHTTERFLLILCAFFLISHSLKFYEYNMSHTFCLSKIKASGSSDTEKTLNS